MTIWQFELVFIPADTDLLVRTNRGFDLAPLARDAVEAIRPVLGISMGKPCVDGTGMAVYGNPEGNRIHFVESGPEGHEMWAGIDARSNADAFCKLVCGMAQFLDCEFFSPEFEVKVRPTRRALLEVLMSSRAWLFALDPGRFRQTAHGWMHI